MIIFDVETLNTKKIFLKMTLDDTDQKILQLISKNAKLGTKEIAASIGLSITPTFERIKRMERNGVILGYVAKLDRNQIGKGLQVYCHTSLKSHNLELINQFEESIKKLDEVVTCHHIAGNIDYLLYIEVADMEEYHQFLRTKLATIPNIANVQTSFVMQTLKEK